MIYMIGGIKGGSGKIIIVVFFVVVLFQMGRSVLLVDVDIQVIVIEFLCW